MSTRKAQAIYLDFIIGLIILILVIALYFKYLPRATAREETALQEMDMDAKSIASSLMTAGLPPDWDAGTVQRIGIVEMDNRLNSTKLLRLANMSYNDAKVLLGVSRDYYGYFQKNAHVLNISGICGFGNPAIHPAPAGANCSFPSMPSSATSVIKVERILIIDNTLARMVILVWQ